MRKDGAGEHEEPQSPIRISLHKRLHRRSTAEQEIVTEIYKSYLSGKSLLNLAAELNARSVEYMPGVIGWNKARIRRILEDARYLGNKTYPAIIPKETYDAVQKIKDMRNMQKGVDRKADIFQITVPS